MRSKAGWLLLSLISASPLSAEEFAMVILPDTQGYSFAAASGGLRLFETQTNWIVGQKDLRNIKFVSHVGDIVDSGSSAAQWNAAVAAMNKLDGVVPYSVLPGNHDYNSTGNKTASDALSNYRTHFGPTRFNPYQWNGTDPLGPTKFFGGFMPATWNGVTSDINVGNSYSYFTAGGRTFLHLALEWQPNWTGVGAQLTNRGVLDWANSIIAANPGMPTILTTHEDLRDADPGQGNGGTTSFGQYIWNNFVRQNDQIFMIISGHNHFGPNQIVNGDGEWRRVDINNTGNPVFRVMTTFQDWPNFGDGYLRILTIDTVAKANNLRFETYSPYRDLYLVDFIGPTASKFSYDLDFDQRFGVIPEPATLLFLLTGVGLMLSRHR